MRKCFASVCALLAASAAGAQEATPSQEDLRLGLAQSDLDGIYSPHVERPYPMRPLFGDTHVHTGYSFDAGAFGARLEPEDAYRFARGEELTSSTGQRVRLSRPLDFLVVADHSDNMGFFPRLLAGDPAYLADPDGRRWYDGVKQGGDAAVAVALEAIDRFSKGTFPKALWNLPGTEAYRSAWTSTIDAAEAANQPGVFTAFIGYEWTSNTGGNNLHRVVVYRDDGEKARQSEPYTTFPPDGSDVPEDLWKALAAYEKATGGRLLAIAHNGNLSNGIMFPEIDPESGKPLSKDYAQTRKRWEPLYEVTQIKGDGETHPFLSPDDEFADYETWDAGNLNLSVPKQPEMLQFEYARRALQTGLRIDQRLGVNPYQFGLIGSTDTHTGLATAEEDNFFGKHSGSEPSAQRATHVVGKFGDAVIMGWEQAASGYAAVWARENTRASIFEAMERRETYATTGPRMVVRFFGGFDFVPADATSRSPAEVGYAKGVPMGGEIDLRGAQGFRPPSFLVAALRDPIGANLDRIQIVKGWVDAKGALHEKVYDVAWSGERKPGADGKLPAVGNTVDVANATFTNTIGAPELIAVWSDPDFDSKARAVYYARVIEIPTPRWTAYDAKRFGTRMPPEVPLTTQERAYTSPIWYSPKR
jgi:hypothetical protein